MSPSKRHQPMAMRVLYGTPAMFHLLGLGPDDGADVQGADRAMTLSGGLVAD